MLWHCGSVGAARQRQGQAITCALLAGIASCRVPHDPSSHSLGLCCWRREARTFARVPRHGNKVSAVRWRCEVSAHKLFGGSCFFRRCRGRQRHVRSSKPLHARHETRTDAAAAAAKTRDASPLQLKISSKMCAVWLGVAQWRHHRLQPLPRAHHRYLATNIW